MGLIAAGHSSAARRILATLSNRAVFSWSIEFFGCDPRPTPTPGVTGPFPSRWKRPAGGGPALTENANSAAEALQGTGFEASESLSDEHVTCQLCGAHLT